MASNLLMVLGGVGQRWVLLPLALRLAGEYTTLPVALQPSDVALQGSFTIYLGANRGRGQATQATDTDNVNRDLLSLSRPDSQCPSLA